MYASGVSREFCSGQSTSVIWLSEQPLTNTARTAKKSVKNEKRGGGEGGKNVFHSNSVLLKRFVKCAGNVSCLHVHGAQYTKKIRFYRECCG